MNPRTPIALLCLCVACKPTPPAQPSGECPTNTKPHRTRLAWDCETDAGIKVGPSTTFYESGRRRAVGAWRDNKRDGLWRLYRESGPLLQEVQWHEGTLVSLQPSLPQCPVGTERRGQPPPHGQAQWCQKRAHMGGDWVNHGPFMSWHDDGEPQAEGSYFNGEPDGEFTMWYPDGTLKVRGRYERGSEEGLFLSWHDNGRLFIRAIYSHGKEEGPWVSWWEEGTKSAEGTFHQGMEQGPWTFWHPNGKMSARGGYEGGRKTGWWHTWSADGNTAPMELYENGARVGTGIEEPVTPSE